MSTPWLVACTTSPLSRRADTTGGRHGLGRCGPWQAGRRHRGPRLPQPLHPLSVPGRPSAGTPSTRCWPRGRRKCPPPRDTERGDGAALLLLQLRRLFRVGAAGGPLGGPGLLSGRARAVSAQRPRLSPGTVPLGFPGGSLQPLRTRASQCHIENAQGREATSRKDTVSVLFLKRKTKQSCTRASCPSAGRLLPGQLPRAGGRGAAGT